MVALSFCYHFCGEFTLPYLKRGASREKTFFAFKPLIFRFKQSLKDAVRGT